MIGQDEQFCHVFHAQLSKMLIQSILVKHLYQGPLKLQLCLVQKAFAL